ncbi:MAG: DegV family protein [Clostridiales bacterium]|nr:DegV family protein [Clostridiales bacterium]
MGIRIITDSTSDIDLAQAKKMGITIVPLKVIFGDREYREGIEITLDNFYPKLISADKLPTTSQPSPDDFLKHFIEAKEAGDSVIVILVSGKLSGTLQSANIAKEIADYSNIFIVDSFNAIMGLRILVEEAVKMRDEGAPVSKIIASLEDLRERIVLLAMVDTLEYLHKGGRLSKTSALLGTLLKFKPIITLKNGMIDLAGKERGLRKGIDRIITLIEEAGPIDKTYPTYFGFTAEDSKCILLRDKVMEKFHIGASKVLPVGCVIGTHAGPGAAAIVYVRK